MELGWDGGCVAVLETEIPQYSFIIIALAFLSLRKKCPNTEFFLFRISLYSD